LVIENFIYYQLKGFVYKNYWSLILEYIAYINVMKKMLLHYFNKLKNKIKLNQKVKNFN